MADPDREENDRSGLGRALQTVGPLLNAGLQMTVGIAIMGALGYFGDRAWGTGPWLMVTGIFFGAGGGLYQFIRMVLALDKKSEASQKSKVKNQQ
jgi:F0F1-type ATP synthase assembly protein I